MSTSYRAQFGAGRYAPHCGGAARPTGNRARGWVNAMSELSLLQSSQGVWEGLHRVWTTPAGSGVCSPSQALVLASVRQAAVVVALRWCTGEEDFYAVLMVRATPGGPDRFVGRWCGSHPQTPQTLTVGVVPAPATASSCTATDGSDRGRSRWAEAATKLPSPSTTGLVAARSYRSCTPPTPPSSGHCRGRSSIRRFRAHRGGVGIPGDSARSESARAPPCSREHLVQCPDAGALR